MVAVAASLRKATLLGLRRLRRNGVTEANLPVLASSPDSIHSAPRVLSDRSFKSVAMMRPSGVGVRKRTRFRPVAATESFHDAGVDSVTVAPLSEMRLATNAVAAPVGDGNWTMAAATITISAQSNAGIRFMLMTSGSVWWWAGWAGHSEVRVQRCGPAGFGGEPAYAALWPHPERWHYAAVWRRAGCR